MQGTTRSGPVSLQLGFAADDFSYLIDLGIPIRSESAFNLDPEIKRELVWSGEVLRPASMLVRRRGPLVELRDGRDWLPVDPRLRTLRVDADRGDRPGAGAGAAAGSASRSAPGGSTTTSAPITRRRPGQTQIGTRTPVLHHDGRDLAAALQTIVEIGDAGRCCTPPSPTPSRGSTLTVRVDAGRFDLQLSAHGLLRPLGAAELSDGTLRYLLLVAALLSPRPPGLMVLNEPETSLHPDLLAPLARLIGQASAFDPDRGGLPFGAVDHRVERAADSRDDRVDQGLRRDPGGRPVRRRPVLEWPLASWLDSVAGSLTSA